MKNFNLLLKNSLKSMSNSKMLVAQFTTLATIATVVISSIFLGNFSLSNSMKDVEKQSNATGFTIKNKQLDNFASYNIINESNKVIDFSTLTMNNLKNGYKIYNPLLNPKQFTIKNKIYDAYGFMQIYENKKNQSNGFWPHIIYSDSQNPLSITTKLSTIKDHNSVGDLFSLYNNILPPNPTLLNNSKYSALFNTNYYSFNPWNLKIYNGQLVVKDFDVIDIIDFENDYTTNYQLNHGVFYKDLAYIVGTEQYFLDNEEVKSYLNEFKEIDKQIYLNNNFLRFMMNNWKQFNKSNNFLDLNDFHNFLNTLGKIEIVDYYKKQFPGDYYEFLNTCNNNLKNNFFQDTKYFELPYSINLNNSTGLSHFFSSIYNSNLTSTQKDEIFRDSNNEKYSNIKYDKYFKGFLKIPIIPYITVEPKNELSIDEAKIWASDATKYNDPNQTKLNISNIQNLTEKAFYHLSNKANSYFSDVLNFKHNNKIRTNYYKHYDLNYYLQNTLNLNYSLSSNFTLSDTNGNSFIISKNKNNTQVNKTVVYEGNNLIPNKINDSYINLSNPNIYFEKIMLDLQDNKNDFDDLTSKNNLLNENTFWNILKILSESWIYSDETTTNEFYNTINELLNMDLFNNNFSKWKDAYYKFWKKYDIANIKWNGSGYYFEINNHNSIGIGLEFVAIYNEPSSYMSILSLNYSQLKNNQKFIVDSKFAEEANKLPYKTKKINNDDVLNNPNKYSKHYIYNPYSKKIEFYNDFVDWLNRLDGKYKINVNGEEFVILGKGISTEFMYPIVSSNQLLINNNSPVVYTNDLGYNKLLLKNNTIPNSNYWINYKNKYDLIDKKETLDAINQWTINVYGEPLAFDLKDFEQPNQLLYLRVNFPKTILNVVFVITLIIGLIIVMLALCFLFILMRSIIKQNLNTFAISMANGINKTKLLFSFIPFVLIPSSISAIVGYGLSFLIYPFIANSIQDYWILSYIHFTFSVGYLLLVFIISTIIIFIVLTIVVFITLRHDVPTLLTKRVEFKYNKLVEISHKFTNKLSPLASFRITYTLGNFSRLLILLIMMTSFVTLTTIYSSTANVFNISMQKTKDNKLYNYAIDLYSPTEQGGYYYNIPYDLVGSRQQGLHSLYNLESNNGFYNYSYKDVLTYNIPNTNKSITYNNLFLPAANLIGDVQGDLQFFKNKIIHLATMDFGINFAGSYINPWEWAKKIMPPSLLELVSEKMQKQLDLAFYYVVNIQNDINNPDRNMWLSNKSPEFSLKQDLNNSKDPAKWNQTNWLFQYVKQQNNKYIWKTNESHLSTGLPNFTMTQNVVNFVTRLISLNLNPNYKALIEKTEKEKNIKIDDYNFLLSLNVVPVINEYDETYTYLDGIINNNYKFNKNNKIKIYGIKPNSNQVILWDEYNGIDLKEKLVEFENNYSNEIKNVNIYPLIINEVVAKKYKLNVGNILNISMTNHFKRFTNKFNNINDLTTYNFKIVGITTSKSEEQYYTTQKIANKILGYEQPKLATSLDIQHGNYDNKWVNQEEINNYIPFNGLFSKQSFPVALSNFATLYPVSGLSPISSGVPNSDNGDSYSQIFNNYYKINKILKMNIVNDSESLTWETIKKFSKKYVEIFETDKYLLPALNGIDASFASTIIGKVVDSTLNNINIICTISLVPSILIIIILMSYMIVQESKRLIALLKVLGFSNWSNTITLSTVQFIVIGFSILLGFGLSIGILELLKYLTFSSLSIIINPIIPWWIVLVTMSTLLIIVGLITATIYISLKNSNPAQEIAIR